MVSSLGWGGACLGFVVLAKVGWGGVFSLGFVAWGGVGLAWGGVGWGFAWCGVGFKAHSCLATCGQPC